MLQLYLRVDAPYRRRTPVSEKQRHTLLVLLRSASIQRDALESLAQTHDMDSSEETIIFASLRFGQVPPQQIQCSLVGPECIVHESPVIIRSRELRQVQGIRCRYKACGVWCIKENDLRREEVLTVSSIVNMDEFGLQLCTHGRYAFEEVRMCVRSVLVVECCHEFSSIAIYLVALPDDGLFTSIPFFEDILQHPFEALSVFSPL